jgi:SAM-dependent methyltransferase
MREFSENSILNAALKDYFSPRRKNNALDKYFDAHLSHKLRSISEKHFTPFEIAFQAALLLVNRPAMKILDIGAGPGKFCIIASRVMKANYYGIEHREHFCNLARDIIKERNMKNINIIHDNFVNHDFKKYDGFYFFNSFEENLDPSNVIDHTVETSHFHFKYYRAKLIEKLNSARKGARLVTYYTVSEDIPPAYVLKWSSDNHLLRLWVKEG